MIALKDSHRTGLISSCLLCPCFTRFCFRNCQSCITLILIPVSPGAPHHIELKSQAFDDSSQKHEHTAKLFSNCFLNAPIHAFVCDKSGNKTTIRTTLNLSWIPASCGILLSKKTQRGEALFEANTLKCGSRTGDQQVKLRVSSQDHKNLGVSVTVYFQGSLFCNFQIKHYQLNKL